MPRRSQSTVGARHRAVFSLNNIRPEHARYGRVEYLGTGAGRCVLCSNPNIEHLYSLTFEIPDGVNNQLVHRTVLTPVGSECIYNWTGYLRENGVDEEHIRAWEEGACAQVRTIENQRLSDRRKAKRIAKLRELFRRPGVHNLYPFVDEIRIQEMAIQWGCVAVDRLIRLVSCTADAWSNEAFPNPNALFALDLYLDLYFVTFAKVNLPFNPRTMRITQPRESTLCLVCALPILRGDTEIASVPDYAISPISREEQETCSCDLCGRESGMPMPSRTLRVVERPRFLDGSERPDIASVQELEQSPTVSTITAESFQNDSRSQRLDRELRELIISALENGRPEIVRSIAVYALNRGQVTERQLRVIRDRAQGRSRPGTAPSPSGAVPRSQSFRYSPRTATRIQDTLAIATMNPRDADSFLQGIHREISQEVQQDVLNGVFNSGEPNGLIECESLTEEEAVESETDPRRSTQGNSFREVLLKTIREKLGLGSLAPTVNHTCSDGS